jgi:ABC-type branched-subunit amino acid transport system permease subunit
MIRARIQQFTDSLREGTSAGFVAGLIVLFLILLGIPIKLQNLALFFLLLTMLIFGIWLARRLHDAGVRHLLINALAMGVVAAVMVFLFMSLINRWQTRGIDVKRYFDAISTETMSVLSGVPAEELHPNPEINPLTGEYETGEPVRTNPMRLALDSDTSLCLKVGLAGESWIDLNLKIGGLYGFLLLLIGVGVLGAVITWATIYAGIGRYRGQATGYLAENPITHWFTLLLPLVFFALLWLTEGQGSHDPVIALGGGSAEVQLLGGFLIILFGLVAVRAAQPTDWRLDYPARLAVCLGMVAFLLALGIWRIVGNKTYFIAPPGDPSGSQTLSIAVIVVIGVALVVQNVLALRIPERFESQFAATLSLGVVALMPLYLDQYQNDVMTLVGINIMLGLGLNIVVGYAGLLDLGYVAFFALGAYTYAFLGSDQPGIGEDGQPGGLKFAGNDEMVIKMAAWVITTVVVAALVVYIGLYLWRRARSMRTEAATSRHTLLNLPAHPTTGTTILLTVLAVGTSLIFASILDGSGLYHRLFNNTSPFLVGLLAGVIVSGLSGIALGIPVLSLRGDYLAIVTLGFGEIIKLMFNNLREYTGGPQGVLKIPRPLPDGASGAVAYLAIVYLVFLGVGLVAFFSARLKQSRTGRAWTAMRDDEDVAQSMGINLVQSKLTAFAIGAAFAGIGGVLFAARQRNIFPKDFTLEVSIEVLSLIIIGGMGSIPGVIVGAIALIGVPEVLRELATYRILVFGALLVVMVIIRPEGLLPTPPPQLLDRARALAHKNPGHHEHEDGQS